MKYWLYGILGWFVILLATYQAEALEVQIGNNTITLSDEIVIEIDNIINNTDDSTTEVIKETTTTVITEEVIEEEVIESRIEEAVESITRDTLDVAIEGTVDDPNPETHADPFGNVGDLGGADAKHDSL